MFRPLALLCFALALIVLAVDLWPLTEGVPFAEITFQPLGEVWFRVAPESYQLLQPAVERHLSPLLWTYVVEPLVLSSLALELAILGAVFWLLRRRRRQRAETRRSGFDPGSRR